MLGLFIATIILYIVHIYIISTRSLHMLQQNRYNRGYRYIKWILRNYKSIFININLLFLIFIICMFSTSTTEYTPYLFVIIYTFITSVFIIERKSESVKLPLKYTARIKRLMVTEGIIYLIPILIMLITFDEDKLAVYYLILGFMSFINHFIILFINFANRPVEKMVSKHFEAMAKDKLKSMNTMEVIGITGSYGKTSTKNALNDILNVKYNSFATPKSFNTMLGLMNAINNYMDKFNDIFIAEAGAFKIGEIKEKADFIKPKYAILTVIGEAHLESFGSRKNIQKGKFELIDSLPDDGVAVLNKDDEYQTSYKIKSKCKTIWVSLKDKSADVYANNIKLSDEGTKFTCTFKKTKENVYLKPNY